MTDIVLEAIVPDAAVSVAIVPVAGARRLSNQIGRVFRGTYGATTGLQTVVRSVARQMLGAGASREAVAHALVGCVLTHPAGPLFQTERVAAGEANSRMLIALTRQCVADVARG